MVPDKKFFGASIYLRGLTDADANETYASWLNDVEVNRYLATKSATIPELLEYIRKKNEQLDALFFGIFLKENDLFIGTIKLEPINFSEKKAMIAIMLGDKSCWGRGYGPEAMRLLIAYCFDELGFMMVDLGVRGQNLGALRSYEKVGFQETKREKNAIKNGDEWLDQVSMEVTPATFVRG